MPITDVDTLEVWAKARIEAFDQGQALGLDPRQLIAPKKKST